MAKTVLDQLVERSQGRVAPSVNAPVLPPAPSVGMAPRNNAVVLGAPAGAPKRDDGFGPGDAFNFAGRQALNVLRTVDLPRAAVASGLKEFADMVASSRVGKAIRFADAVVPGPLDVLLPPPLFAAKNVLAAGEAGDASFDEFKQQVNQRAGARQLGFTNVVPGTQLLPESVSGFITDVAMDPLTYTPGVFAKQAIRIGVKGVARDAAEGALLSAVKSGSSRQISETLATNALKAGVADSAGIQSLIADAAIRGRGALTFRGLQRAGVTADDAAKLGLRVESPNVAVRTLQGAENVKGAIKQTFRTTEAAKGFRRLFVSERYGRRALLNDTLNKSLPVSRRAKAVLAEVATDRSVAQARQWAAQTMRSAELQMVGSKKAPGVWANLSDEQGRVATRNMELGVGGAAEDVGTSIFSSLFDQLEQRFGVPLRFRKNYVAHIFTDEFYELTKKDARAKAMFDSVMSLESFQKERRLNAGDMFLGEVLREGTIDEINGISTRVLGQKVLYDDLRDILPRYIMKAEDSVQRALQIKQFQELGLGEPLARKLADRTDPDYVKAVEVAQNGYKAAVAARKIALRNGTVVRYDLLKNIRKVFELRQAQFQARIADLEQQLAIQQRKVVDLQSQVDDLVRATDALQANVDVAAARLQAATGAEKVRLQRELKNAQAKLRRTTVKTEKQIADLRAQIDAAVNPRATGPQTRLQREAALARTKPKMQSIRSLQAELEALRNATRSIHDDYMFVMDAIRRGPTMPDEAASFGFSQPGLFHGSSSDVVEFTPWGSRSAENLFGSGVYTTDRPSVAYTYTRKGAGQEPNIYRIEWAGAGSPNVLDLTGPQPVMNRVLNDVLNNLEDATWFDPAEDVWNAARAAVADPNVSAEAAYKAVRDAVVSARLPVGEADEIMDQVTEKLMDSGIDALTYKGGVRVGGAGEHNVTIFLDQGNVRIVEKGVPGPPGARTLDRGTPLSPEDAQRLAQTNPDLAVLQESVLNASDLLDMFMAAKNRVMAEKDLAETIYLFAAADAQFARNILETNVANLENLITELSTITSKGPATQEQLFALRDKFDAVRNMLDRADMSPEMQAVLKLEAAASQADLAAAKAGNQVKLFEDMLKTLESQKKVTILDEASRGMVQVGQDLQIPEWLSDATKVEWAKREMPAMARWQQKYFNLFKGYAILRPGFHVRNLYSAMFGMFLDRGPQSFANVKRWHDFYTMATHNPEGYMADAVKKFGQVEADRLDQVWQAIAGTGAGGGMAEFVGKSFRKPSKSPFDENNYALALSRRAGGWVEDHVRGAHAYDVLRSGGTMEQAMDTVNRWQFNYVDVTDFDQKMKLINPFWVFFSRNMALQAQTWVKATPKINQTFVNFERNMNYGLEEDGVVPQYFYTEGATRLPFKGLQGESVYWFSDLPALTLPGELGRLSNPTDARFFADLGPFLKIPVELIANRQLFSDIPIDTTRPERLPLGLGRLPGAGNLAALPGLERGASGELLMNAEIANALQSAIPGYGQVQRIAPVGDAAGLERLPYTGTSFLFGTTLSENAPRAQKGELYRRNIAMAEQLKQLRRLQEM